MLEKSLFQRLERKADEVLLHYRQNENNWEETFYQLLARNFGFKINAEPFFQLAKLLPLKILMKHSDQLVQLEALLFGQAGFLDGAKGDEYYKVLQREHRLLMQKYSLQQTRMSRSQWRYLRLRPANFPSLRLAQFAALLHQRRNLFSAVLECDNVNSFLQLFTVPTSPYWLSHYQFSKESGGDGHDVGLGSRQNIFVNTMVPVWVAYGKQTDQQVYIDKAVEALQQLPAEENKITRTWNDVGMSARTAFDSQALVELYNSFCLQKNCLHCTVGTSLMHPVS
jgi:hypothetical protein